jgi:serine/threonine-protein kinase
MPESKHDQVDDAIDAIADEFEGEWKAGRRPDLRGFAARLEGGRRLRLLIELICVDWEYRLRRGGLVDLGDYVRDFPELRDGGDRGGCETLRRFAAGLDHARGGLSRPPGLIGQGADKGLTAARSGGAGDSTVDAGKIVDCPRQNGAGPSARLIAGRYRLVAELGRGSFGSVWRAVDQLMEKEGEQRGLVAVKLLEPREWTGDTELESALGEARAMFPIDHPNVLHVKDAGYDAAERVAFIVMQLCYDERDGQIVRGQTLQERVDQEGPLPARAAARVMVAICRGVAAAHAQGRVHRDLAPKNILLRTSTDAAAAGERLWPVVSDFGLSLSRFRFRARGSSAPDETKSLRYDPPSGGEVCGTPAYMAPEQADGAPATPLSDVFGLGGILYYLLSRQMPYVPVGAHPDRGWDVVEQKRARNAPRPLCVPKLPQRLAAVCAQALALDPRARYGSAAEMADELQAWLDDRPTVRTRPRQRRPELAHLWYRRHRAAATVGLIGVAAIVASTALYVHSVDRERADKQLAERDATFKDQFAKFTAQESEERLSLLLATVNKMMAEVRAHRAPSGAFTPEAAGMTRVIVDELDRIVAMGGDASPQVARGVGVVLVRVGDHLQILGDSQKAADAYRKAIAIFNRAASDSTAEQASYDVAAAQLRLGLLSLRAGRTDEARTMLDATLRVTTPLSRQPNADPSLLRDHWAALLGAGDLALQMGDLDAAVARFDEAIRVIPATPPPAAVPVASPGADLATTLNRLAGALLRRFDRTRQTSDLRRARECAFRAAATAATPERVSTTATTQPSARPAPDRDRALLMSHELLAAVAVRATEFDDARHQIEQCQALLVRSSQAPGGAQGVEVDAASIRYLQATVDAASGAQPAAEAGYRAAFDILDRLRRDGKLAIDPRGPQLLEQVSAALRGTPLPQNAEH